MVVNEEEYVNDLIAKSLETKYPLAVINDEEKFQGIMLRIDMLSGLISKDLEVFETVEGY